MVIIASTSAKLYAHTHTRTRAHVHTHKHTRARARAHACICLQVYAIDSRFVDPRRPKRAKPTPEEIEERLLPYADTLPLSTIYFITLDKEVRARVCKTIPCSISTRPTHAPYPASLTPRRRAQRACKNGHTHPFLHTFAHAHSHTNTHTHKHTYAQAHTRTSTHTHAHHHHTGLGAA